MSSYLITGASKGIGFEFLNQLSGDSKNTVIGLVRNKAETEAKVAPLNRSNIHIVQGDLEDYESLKRAADETAKITGGGLDYLIANAAYQPEWSAMDTIAPLADHPATLEKELIDIYKVNVIGNIHLFNTFVPLILQGDKKKVIAITSGMGDTEVAAKHNFDWGVPYSISKAAGNMTVAKFSAQYAKDGVLFMSVCPGVVDTGKVGEMTEEMQAKFMRMAGKLQAYAPHWTGPVSPESSVKDMLKVVEKASLANGDGGSFVSHFGTKQYL